MPICLTGSDTVQMIYPPGFLLNNCQPMSAMGTVSKLKANPKRGQLNDSGSAWRTACSPLCITWRAGVMKVYRASPIPKKFNTIAHRRGQTGSPSCPH